MDSELIKWLSQMPKNYELSGSKKKKVCTTAKNN